MRRIRKHFTFANVASAIALFVALGGGTAVALNGSNTVQSDDLGPGAQVKAPDVAANAVKGSNVADGSLGVGDLSANARPHKLEFGVPAGTGKTTIATVGNLQVSGSCDSPASSLFVYLKNRTGQNATMNALLTRQTSDDGAVTLFTVGQFVGPGDETTLDNTDATDGIPIAGGGFNRVEGQLVFQSPGRVTTVDFHAFTITGGSPRCEFYGTAVTSNVS
jgi:hypothetical protein